MSPKHRFYARFSLTVAVILCWQVFDRTEDHFNILILKVDSILQKAYIFFSDGQS